jgi:hypothetical protein
VDALSEHLALLERLMAREWQSSVVVSQSLFELFVELIS